MEKVKGVRVCAALALAFAQTLAAGEIVAGEALLYDGALGPACVWDAPAGASRDKACRPIEVVEMVIEGTYDQAGHYYCGYTFEAQKHLPALLETPPYRVRAEGPRTVQIAELAYFGTGDDAYGFRGSPAGLPDDLPLPNPDGTVAFPETRLVRDWLLFCA